MKLVKNFFFARVWLGLLLVTLGLNLTACTNPFDNSAAPVGPTPTSAPTAPAPTAVITSGSTTTVAATSGPATTAVATPGQTTLTTVPATITRANGQTLAMTVELARTPQEQETGLMGRTGLPTDRGMLFIFPQSGQVGFWMKDTPLALSIAFIDASGKILNIQDMQPFSEQTHSPGQDYLYALEVPQGYFAAKNVRPGDTFSFKS